MLDLALTTPALVLLAPLLAVVALGVWVRMGRPILFAQPRLGLDEKVFSVLKFRTMTNATGPDGLPLSDARRLTPLGSFLRRTSLDELPQLWNVLKGEMSLIGPRPLFPEYVDYYTTDERLRHTVRPGITGLAQVSGRNLLTWEERLALDSRYAREATPLGDLSILARTIAGVICRRDVIVIPGELLGRLDACRRPYTGRAGNHGAAASPAPRGGGPTDSG